MAISMPKIDVIFKQLAASLIARSERGIAILIVRDDTDSSFTHKSYTNLIAAQEDEAKFTQENFTAISDVLTFTPYKTYIVRIGTEDTLSDAIDVIEKYIPAGWITIAGGTSEDWTALISWIKSQEMRQSYYKAAVFNASAPDCKHVLNFCNETVTFADSRGQQSGAAYLPSLIAIAAVCNINRGMTNYLCSNLTQVQAVSDNDTALQTGKFILVNDSDEVRIALGLNSMTTTNGSTATEDMKFIEVVEAMDMIADDIRKTFKTEYLGCYKNTRDNQMLFISSIRGYFKNLANINVLNPDYNNMADIDVTAQRDAWLASGKSDAEKWDDAKVRSMPFKRDVFLAGDIHILQCMTNLTFNINMA